MKHHALPNICFWLCKAAGFGLLFAFWLESGAITGFFLFLFLIVMTLLRWRFPILKHTVALDMAACILLSVIWGYPPYFLALPLFSAMYLGAFWVSSGGLYLLFDPHPLLAALYALSALCGLFLGLWKRELHEKLNVRDTAAGRYYELESLQNELTATLAQIERMTAVAERTRIARDIHDNAGHEIVAAYISLQTARAMMVAENTEALELYDAALERLNSGAAKIRETVHNLSAVTSLGVETLQDICRRFPCPSVTFHAYGDTTKIPVYIWNVLEACLSESLTNIARHTAATQVSVNLDTTPHIVRLCIENDGVAGQSSKPPGSGLRNLRHRAVAIGGNLSIDANEATFRVVCVIPFKEDPHETAHC
ncbi:MAG: histidine kinase [Oscillospiraceae bacterium]|nr:histidine kinase [Oscillospiraceae bacterium]